MATPPYPDALLAVPDLRYRRRPELRLGTIEAAGAFIRQVGLAFLFPIRGAELPSLWEAICGRAREVTPAHHDPDMEKTWGWKDAALGERRWYYAKLFLEKATFVDLELLPHLYALRELAGDPDDASDR